MLPPGDCLGRLYASVVIWPFSSTYECDLERWVSIDRSLTKLDESKGADPVLTDNVLRRCVQLACRMPPEFLIDIRILMTLRDWCRDLSLSGLGQLIVAIICCGWLDRTV